MVLGKGMRRVLTLAMVLAGSSGASAADDGVWSVGKSSGDVWMITTGAAPASLTQEDSLKPGDTIRTGRNGRVLLVRGEETILIAPNSVIGVPTEKKDGLSTTILQQAGSILLEVEKRNVKHFEVETPYLAAVVKGTQFSVTVTAANTRVDVNRGQVEVADFKSGQIAQVKPGQAATSFAHGKSGLSLSGSGTFNPIEQGKPRASSIDRIPVPKGGLHAPNNAEGKSIHALGPVGSGKLANNAGPQSSKNVVHLSTALGEVRLNVQKATHGLAHGGTASGSIRNASRESKDTIWSDSKSNAGLNGSSSGNGNSSNSGNTSASGGASPAAAAVAAATSGAAGDAASAANGNGNGNGAANGIGNGNGATGNGKAANGIGNNGIGNGLGNGGVGNGNGKGNAKH
jgi:FecR protein